MKDWADKMFAFAVCCIFFMIGALFLSLGIILLRLSWSVQ